MRRSDGRPGDDAVGMTGGGLLAPPVHIEVCSCGCRGDDTGHDAATAPAPEPDWALATAWAFLTRPVEADRADDLADDLDDAAEASPAHLPWWDARSSASKRRAVLPLVLLGELQAGVLLRAVWEVVQSGSGPTA